TRSGRTGEPDERLLLTKAAQLANLRGRCPPNPFTLRSRNSRAFTSHMSKEITDGYRFSFHHEDLGRDRRLLERISRDQFCPSTRHSLGLHISDSRRRPFRAWNSQLRLP